VKVMVGIYGLETVKLHTDGDCVFSSMCPVFLYGVLNECSAEYMNVHMCE
jgi:hypothetical protein